MTNEKHIWDKLKAAGLSDAGAAGLMGNLYAESALNPQNLQNSFERKLGYDDASYTAAVDAGTYTNFAHDGAGYGLAQWTYHTRKAALLAFARERGCSVGDLDMQLDFLLHELAADFPKVLGVLKSATDVRAASDAVLLEFEKPADTSASVRERRAGFAAGYFEKYAGEGVTGVDEILVTIGGKRFRVMLEEMA